MWCVFIIRYKKANNFRLKLNHNSNVDYIAYEAVFERLKKYLKKNISCMLLVLVVGSMKIGLSASEFQLSSCLFECTTKTFLKCLRQSRKRSVRHYRN